MNEQNQNQSAQTPFEPNGPRRFYRSVADRKLAGVCGGIAEHFGLDSGLVRVLWVISCFFGLVGALAYIVIWAIVPDNPLGMSAQVRPPSNTSRYAWGTLLIVIGVVWLAERNGFDFLVPWRWMHYWPNWLSFGVIFSVLLIGLGFFLIFRGVPEKPFASSYSASPASNFAPFGDLHMSPKRLTRSRNERMIGGVCGGLAEHFNLDPSLVRVGWVLITFFSGIFLGIIAYIVLLVVVPESEPQHDNKTSIA